MKRARNLKSSIPQNFVVDVDAEHELVFLLTDGRTEPEPDLQLEVRNLDGFFGVVEVATDPLHRRMVKRPPQDDVQKLSKV